MEEANKASVLEQEWSLEFHGTSYLVNLIASDIMLILEIESAETSERWSGEFTAQYLEEITHKAGNFKKFAVFTKMLSSAFSKDSDSVFIDILTYSDLELLKARKTAAMSANGSVLSATTSSSTFSSKQFQKRYAILTYCGEFDRVHYPLPLSFEESPNVPALKRTIARLRKQLRDRDEQAKEPANDKEKELRQIVSQLRQDNTELRHRLRQQHTTSGLNSSISGGASSGSAGVNAELAAANTKLRKQVESLRRELSDASVSYERLRTDSAKELSRWKQKLGVGARRNSAPIDLADSSGNKQAKLISELRHRVASAERELRLERLKNGSSTHPRFESSTKSKFHSKAGVSSDNDFQSRTKPELSRNSRPSYTPSSIQQKRYSRPTAVRSESPPVLRRRADTPPSQRPYQQGTSRNPRSGIPNYSSARRSQSVSPSSSLGGRFDPTAYQQQRQQRFQNRLVSSKASPRAWNAGPSIPHHQNSSSNYRYRSPSRGESGYASGNSQSSAGSSRIRKRNGSGYDSGHGSDSSRGSRKSKHSISSKGSDSDAAARVKKFPKSALKKKVPKKDKREPVAKMSPPTAAVAQAAAKEGATEKRLKTRKSAKSFIPSNSTGQSILHHSILNDDSSIDFPSSKKKSGKPRKGKFDPALNNQYSTQPADSESDDVDDEFLVHSSAATENNRRISSREFTHGIAGSVTTLTRPSEEMDKENEATNANFPARDSASLQGLRGSRNSKTNDSMSHHNDIKSDGNIRTSDKAKFLVQKSSTDHVHPTTDDNSIVSYGKKKKLNKDVEPRGTASVASSIASLDSADMRNSVQSGTSKKSFLSNLQPDEDISEIDKRIQALQSYLDSARKGIITVEKGGSNSETD